MTNLFIPSKIRIGFQKRGDTFTGKLAYIIYYDANGQIKQEKSWEKWRDKNIPFVEFDNNPRSGYIFNKGVQRNGHWGSGRSVIRVYDPRDFEFEIDIDNLIGLLMHSDVSKRDIVEECVFAWSGNNVILLPVNSDDYQKGVVHTEKQGKNVTAEELVPGHSYSHKKDNETYTYIGYYTYFEPHYWNSEVTRKGKQHVFYNGKNFEMVAIEKLSECVSSEMHSDFSKLVDDFFKSKQGNDIGKITYGVPKNNGKPLYLWNSGELYRLNYKVENGLVSTKQIKLDLGTENTKDKKIVRNPSMDDRWYYDHRRESLERHVISTLNHYCSDNSYQVPIDKFIEVIKSLDYKSAYHVDAQKKKIEI